MYCGRTNVSFDLFFVILDHSLEGKAIFGLKSVNGLSGLIVETPFQNGTLRHMKIEHMPCQLYGHSGYDLAALSAWVTMTTLTARAPATPLCHPVAYVAMLWVIPRTITVAPWLPKSLTKRWRPGGSLIVFLLLPLSISKPLQY